MTEYPSEATVIGGMLVDPEMRSVALEALSPKSFGDPRARCVFRAIVTLDKQGKPVDFSTVADVVREAGQLVGLSHNVIVIEFAEKTTTLANYPYHIKTVKEGQGKRELKQALQHIVADVDSGASFEDALDRAETAVMGMQSTNEGSVDYTQIASGMDAVMAEYERVSKGGASEVRTPTGFRKLDALLSGGFERKTLVILGGDSSVGKTTFLLGLAIHAADNNRSVGILSLETDTDKLLKRVLCSMADVPLHQFNRGRLTDKEWLRITPIVSRVSSIPIFVDASNDLSTHEMRRKVRKMKREHKVDIVFLDYLQLMTSTLAEESRRIEVERCVRACKSIAKEQDLTFVALSQLSLAHERREEKRPTMGDLRESGAIGHEADYVILLYRPSRHAHATPADLDRTECILTKHKDGPTGTVEMEFDVKAVKFREPEPKGVVNEYG